MIGAAQFFPLTIFHITIYGISSSHFRLIYLFTKLIGAAPQCIFSRAIFYILDLWNIIIHHQNNPISDWFIYQSVHFDRKGFVRIKSMDGFDVLCQRSLFVHWKWTFSKSTFTPNWTPIWELATISWRCDLLLSSCFLQGYVNYFGTMNEEIIQLKKSWHLARTDVTKLSYIIVKIRIICLMRNKPQVWER